MKRHMRYQAAVLVLALLVSFSSYAAGDPLRYQQWALHNDGSFTTEEAYTVYQNTDGFGITDAVTAGIDINITAARENYRAVRPVTVALIDTGADISHPDLTDAIWSNAGEIANNGIDDDGNGYIDDMHGWNFTAGDNILYAGSEDNHGTHCAGTIAAAAGNGVGIEGITAGAPVRLMILKVLSGSDGTLESVIEAIRYAEANGAVICNLSIGAERLEPPLYQIMNESQMLFVVAAGNRGVDADKQPMYPAAFDLDNVISVANIQPDGTLMPMSNYGVKSVDIAAPGTLILSTVNGGEYGYMTGTSMAAPMVTAAAALAYSHYGDAALAEVKQILLDTATPLESLSGMTVSGGLLNIGAALSAGEPPDTPPQPAEPVFADIAGHWAERDISEMAERGLWNGTGSGMFSPQGSVSRAMIATVLWRLAGSPEPADAPEFSDVADSEAYYYKAVAWAAENGVTEGYYDGSFRPGVPVTRQQLAALLFRYANSIGADTSARGMLTDYGDWHSFQIWALEPCAWAVGSGLMIGRSADTWAPNGEATRAEAATLTSRLAAMTERE